MQIKVDYLIIGQGICGTFLGHELQKAKHSFIIIDDARPFTASRVASGIINPVTGRRIVKTWLIDDLMPFAWKAYNELGTALGISCINEIDVIDFFPTPQMRMAYLTRYEEDRQYLSSPNNSDDWHSYFNYDFGNGTIHPCYLIHLNDLLQTFRLRLIQNNCLIEEYFEEHELVMQGNSVSYKDIEAGKIILCDGVCGMESIYFKNLPFAPNKGEALIAEIKDLPYKNVYKKVISVVPWKDGLFWVGSSHEWQFKDDQPTDVFRERTIGQLRSFCKMPFTIVDHWASVRAATLERRPFVGIHPVYPQIAILNGMGTKGCSLAPYLARQLAMYFTQQTALMPEVNVQRFNRVLQRK